MVSLIRSKTRGLAALVAASLMMLGRPALAASTDLETWVAQGQLAFDEGHYQAAKALYQRALGVRRLPALYFNIGQCERQLGQRALAAESYRRYLALSPEGKHAQVAQGLLSQLEATPTAHSLALTPASTLTDLPPEPLRREPEAAASDASKRNTWLVVGLGVVAASATAVAVIASQGNQSPHALRGAVVVVLHAASVASCRWFRAIGPVRLPSRPRKSGLCSRALAAHRFPVVRPSRNCSCRVVVNWLSSVFR